MKPCSFEYVKAESLEHALAVLVEHGDEAKILAGGQSLVPAMNFRLAQPAVLVDLNGVGALSGIERVDGMVQVGAMTRQRSAERSSVLSAHVPLVTETMPFIAHAQIRNRGTFGGSIAHADPSAELPAISVALSATLQVTSSRGSRSIAASDFYVDLLTTALEADEILVRVDLPIAVPGSGFAFAEVSRRHGDYALVGVAASVQCDASGVCQQARVSLLSVGPGPVLSTSCAAALIGERPTTRTIADAAAATASDDIDPEGDIHASARFRRHLARVLVERTLTRAFARAAVSAGAAEQA